MNFKELQKQEAIKRMKALKLSKDVVKDFNDNGRLYYSERQSSFFDGILYWVDNEEVYLDIVERFEKRHNALVYHAQLTHTDFGSLFTLLFVSEEEEEWANDLEDINTGDVFACVLNLNAGYGPDYGYVGISPKNGGVTRTY